MSDPIRYQGHQGEDPITSGRDFVNRNLTVYPPANPDRDDAKPRTAPGSVCPCCNQLVVLRKRKLTYQSALTLMELYYYHLNPGDPYWDWYNNSPDHISGYMHLPTMFQKHPEPIIRNCVRNREHGRISLWGLARGRQQDREDGMLASEDTRVMGYYRITMERGVNFVTDTHMTVPRWLWIYQKRVLFQTDGNNPDIPREVVNIEAVMGESFHYEEIIPPGDEVETVSDVIREGRRRYRRYRQHRAAAN